MIRIIGHILSIEILIVGQFIGGVNVACRIGIQEKDKKTNESVITVFSFIVFISNFSNNRIVQCIEYLKRSLEITTFSLFLESTP